jgi:hypothetical protein
MQKTRNNEGLMLYHRALSYSRIIWIIVRLRGGGGGLSIRIGVPWKREGPYSIRILPWSRYVSYRCAEEEDEEEVEEAGR